MASFSRTFDERRTIERLTKLYGLGPKVLRCSKIINGHINDTYNVTVLGADGKSHSYIYQRVNSSVFSDISCTSICFSTGSAPYIGTTDYYRYAANPVRCIKE